MLCPQCATSMNQEHHGVTIDHCPSCGGIWFDADELRAALKRPSSARLARDPSTDVPDPDGATLFCPRCSVSNLEVRQTQGAQIHRCDGCLGVFVGSRALLRILDRNRYGVGDGALDVLILAPEIPEAALQSVLEILADVLSGW